MTRQPPDFIEPVSVLPSLGIFITLFLLLNLIFRALTLFINVAPAFVLPFVMVMLLISCFYAIYFFIRKHKRYFLTSELLFIVMGSIVSVWILQALLDGVLALNQFFLQALMNGAFSVLFQAVPITVAYAYLGRYMLVRFLANNPDLLLDKDDR